MAAIFSNLRDRFLGFLPKYSKINIHFGAQGYVNRKAFQSIVNFRVRLYDEVGEWRLVGHKLVEEAGDNAWMVDNGIYDRRSPYYTDPAKFEDFKVALKRLFFLPFYEMLERHLEETDYDGGRVATFDRSYLFDKIVRWSHTVGFGGNWFRMQIGAQLRVKAGSQSMASAMNMALARK